MGKIRRPIRSGFYVCISLFRPATLGGNHSIQDERHFLANFKGDITSLIGQYHADFLKSVR